MEKRHIVFSSAYSEKDFKVIQLEKDVEEAINNGETVYIKGDKGEQCVLATNNKSYAIEKIDTSNTVLLSQTLGQGEMSVQGCCGTILELVNNPLDVHRILSHIPDLSDTTASPVDLDVLTRCCTYSRGEIERCIQSCPYVVMDLENHYFRLENREYYSLMMDMINKCILAGITLSSFSLDSVVSVCDQIQPFVTKHLVAQLTDEGPGSQVLTVHKAKLVQLIIRDIFVSATNNSSWLSQEELQTRIDTLLPSEFDFDIDSDYSCLRGIAIHENRNTTKGFRYIDKDDLAMKPEARFRQLFGIESEWSQEDILPFIEDLDSYGYGKPGDLLLKYCREVTTEENGVTKKHYVLRR